MRTTPSSLASWLALLLMGALLVACGPKTLKDRTRHGEKLSDEAAPLLDAAERDLSNTDADHAEQKLKEAEKLLSHPDIQLSPEGEMLQSRLSELQARLAPTRQEKSRKELDDAVEKQRDSLMQAKAEVDTALEALERKDAGKPQLDAVLQAVEKTQERLKQGKSLEAKSEDYGASVRRTEKLLEQATAKARSVQQVVDFVSGPAAARQEAEALAKQGQAEKDPDKQLALYTDARTRFQRCSDTAKELITKTPELEKAPILVEGRPTTPKTIAASCDTRANAFQKVVARLEQTKAAREKKKAAAAAKGKSKKG